MEEEEEEGGGGGGEARNWEQTAIIPLYSINLSVFITEAESVYVYCAVRTASLNETDTVSSFKGDDLR
jgi:hypothetical protein